jgi:hypothetical protein
VTNDGEKAAQRALDLLVYAPVGVALYLRDTVPTFVNLFVARGRSEVGQRRQQAHDQVTQARALGEFAVGFGGPKLREQVEKGIAIARKGADAVLSGVGEGGAPTAESDTPVTRDDSTSRPGPVAVPATEPAGPTRAEADRSQRGASRLLDATALVIPDYDELSASQVVERLDGLHPGELEAVRAYEEAHRARRTILFKIEQLTG